MSQLIHTDEGTGKALSYHRTTSDGKRRGLTSEGEAEALRLLRAGGSVREVAQQLGVATSTVTNLLARQPVERSNTARAPRLGARKDLALSDAEIGRLYQAGRTLAELAQQCQVTTTTIRTRLTDQGIEIKKYNPPGSTYIPAGSSPMPLPLSDAELVRRYRAGESLSDLSRACGVVHNTIRHRLARNGVPIRDRRGARGGVPATDSLPESVWPALIADYEAGNGLNALGRKYKVGAMKVKAVLEGNHVPIRASGGATARVLTTAKKQEILALWRQGMSKAAVATAAGVSSTTVDKALADDAEKGPEGARRTEAGH